MHSHLIPGIDDGAPDLGTSVNLIRGMQELGFKSLITTPHIMSDLYPNTPEIILSGLAEVRKALEQEGIDIPIHAAAEYLLDEGFAEKLAAGNLLTLKGNYVLVEMSFIAATPNLDQVLFDMQTKGYRPVMAHPERYPYFQGDLQRYERLKDQGCLLQMNLLSLLGYYGKDVRQIATNLIKAGLYDLAGTDLHHERHHQALKALLKNCRAAKLMVNYSWKNQLLIG
jgi:tyrosine-protein phosphatase YwqE